MTRYRSDETPSDKRPWCVVPYRSIRDKELKHEARLVLMALGYYANRAGVCWPSLRTLVEDTGLAINTVQGNLERLVKGGYVRRLVPNDYDQPDGAWGKSNRYQVLLAGNDALPTYEQIQDANVMQHPSDQMIISDTKGSGARDFANTTPAAHRAAAAIAAAVERATGSRPVISDWATCTRLADTAPATLEQAVRLVVQRTGRVPSVRDVWETVQTLAAG